MKIPLPADHRPLITDHWLLATRHLPLCLLLLTLGTGCRLLQKAANVPGQAVQAVTPGNPDKPAADPVEVQQMLLRFADEYTTRMVFGIDKLQRGTNAPDTAEILRWKITLATETCSIATGPKAVANLLDMVIFVTVTRMALEDHWQPKVFGESALPLLESAQSSEAEIWLIAGGVLQPEQQTELRRAIEIWYAQNPLPESVTAARALGFASQVAEADKADAAKPGSVFSLLGVDPLAGMDPAVRETGPDPDAGRARPLRDPEDADGTAVADGIVDPQLDGDTRRAAGGLELHTNRGFDGTLRRRCRETAGAGQHRTRGNPQGAPVAGKGYHVAYDDGTAMSTSLNTTLTTLDTLMKRFGVGETNKPSSPPATNAEPFRIQDYTQPRHNSKRLRGN